MKVLHIITGLKTGGAEKMLLRLSAMSDPRIVHEVISLRGLGKVGEPLKATGIPVRSLDMFGVGAPLAVARLVRAIRRARPDVVQTWMYHANVIGGLAARIAGVKSIVWNVRTADLRQGISLSRATLAVVAAGARLSRRIPGRIVYVAEAARRSHEAVGYDASKSLVIHNGFDLHEPVECEAMAHALRAAVGLPLDSLVISTAGTFTAQKNQLGVLAAAAALLATRPDIHIILVGRNVSSENRSLTEAAQRTGHSDRIHLLGEREGIVDILAASDLFCLASSGEGFPNVVGEAMAVGTPVLVTDVGDARLLVGDTGTVVPPNDPAALEAALLALGSMPRAVLAERGRIARERIVQHFSMATVKGSYLSLYRSLIAAKETG